MEFYSVTIGVAILATVILLSNLARCRKMPEGIPTDML